MSQLEDGLAEIRRLQAEADQRAARDDIGDEFKLTQLEDQMFKGKSETVRVYAVDR